MSDYDNITQIPQSAIFTSIQGTNLYDAVMQRIKNLYSDDSISLRIDSGSFIDVKVVGRNSDSIKIVEIREIIDFLHLSPGEGKYKFVIICNAENMNINAANALLKILEEPPKNSYIFLLSFFYQQLPETILSRCQLMRLKKIEYNNIDSIFDPSLNCEKDFYNVPQDDLKSFYLNLIEALSGSNNATIEIINSLDKTEAENWKFFKLSIHNLYMKAIRNNFSNSSEQKVLTLLQEKFQSRLIDKLTEISNFLKDSENFYLDKRSVAISIMHINE